MYAQAAAQRDAVSALQIDYACFRCRHTLSLISYTLLMLMRAIKSDAHFAAMLRQRVATSYAFITSLLHCHSSLLDDATRHAAEAVRQWLCDMVAGGALLRCAERCDMRPLRFRETGRDIISGTTFDIFLYYAIARERDRWRLRLLRRHDMALRHCRVDSAICRHILF